MISIEINDNLLHLSEFMKFVEAQGQNLGGIAAALQQDALELYELHAWNRKI